MIQKEKEMDLLPAKSCTANAEDYDRGKELEKLMKSESRESFH